ncbi:cytochrome b N-terminal domain-containing protein [Candidatus Obscuribacterales bacterium]|nr:cytochrome b N-terminal domain-containing protein [Candidatus Obscuribacterales bacterium]MBX3150025.1 cytochrome b N-terminal domain-containing protein [Candidatus Obscuribacterales bacterium]
MANKVIDKALEWLEDRTGLVKPFIHMMLHPVPGKSTWAYVFGTAIMTSFIVQLASGVALSTLYVPSGSQAWESIKWITEQVPFGSWLRATHYFGASAMIIFVGAHAIRTYLFGSFKFPRELNWISGVFLLFLTVAIAFTGQVLRWDQTAVWTIAVGAEQALRAPFVGPMLVRVLCSGDNVSSASLSHFFAMHVFIFPALLVALIGFHVWLVLHHGISEPPKAGKIVKRETYREEYQELLKKEGVAFWPHAAWRDAVFSTLVVLGICACALYFGPPVIENPPDPSLINAEPKPDWYLTWYFALLALVPAQFEDWFILLFPVFLVVGMLTPPFISNTGERSARRRPWAVAIVVVVVGSVLALWQEGVNEYWTPRFEATPVPKTAIGTTDSDIEKGAKVFNDRGCLYCHVISGHGGRRGPDLTDVGERLSPDQITIRIVNGGVNMPAYAGNMSAEELKQVTKFLESRRPHGLKTGPSTHLLKGTVPVDLRPEQVIDSSEVSGSPAQKLPKLDLAPAEIARIAAIAQDGMTEVRLGKLAESKASDPEVKKLASLMVTEHSAANEQLKELAAGVGLILPPDINNEQKALIDSLSELSGSDFDKRYVEVLMDAHMHAITVFETEVREGSGSLKDWAKNVLRTIKRHHHAAMTLSK